METGKKHIVQKPFQCFKRLFIKGVRVSEWQEVAPIIEYGDTATSEMLIDSSGYFITDNENQIQYFVNMNQLNKIKVI